MKTFNIGDIVKVVSDTPNWQGEVVSVIRNDAGTYWGVRDNLGQIALKTAHSLTLLAPAKAPDTYTLFINADSVASNVAEAYVNSSGALIGVLESGEQVFYAAGQWLTAHTEKE